MEIGHLFSNPPSGKEIKRPAHPVYVRWAIVQYSEYYRTEVAGSAIDDGEPPKGLWGATTGIINHHLGGKDMVRRMIFGFMFGNSNDIVTEIHSKDLSPSMKRAIIAWVNPNKEESGEWSCDGYFQQEVIKVANLALTMYNSHASIRILNETNEYAKSQGLECATDDMVFQSFLLGGKLKEILPPEDVVPEIAQASAVKQPKINSRNIATLI